MAADELTQLARPSEFARLWGYSVGFYGVWLIHVGREAGLLEKLAAGPLSIEQLISATKLYTPAVRAWCSAAASYGLVSKKKEKLYLKPAMQNLLLDKKHPDYLGGQFSYLALRSLEYSGLSDLFTSGRTRDISSTFRAIEQATDWDHYSFLAAIKRYKKLHQQLAKGCRVLDVGSGSGSLLTKMKSAYPRSSFVGIDPSKEAIAIAQKAKSIKMIKQYGESMKFESEFDLIYLGESLYAARDKQKVISNCRRALRPGGTIAIVEGLLPESDLQSDESRLIMGMQLDFAQQGYVFMTRKEVAKLLRRFSDVRFEDFGGSVYLVTGRK